MLNHRMVNISIRRIYNINKQIKYLPSRLSTIVSLMFLFSGLMLYLSPMTEVRSESDDGSLSNILGNIVLAGEVKKFDIILDHPSIMFCSVLVAGIVVAFALGIFAIMLIASVLLLRAIKKRDHFFMIPYLTLTLFTFIFCCYDFKNITAIEDILAQAGIVVTCGYIFIGIYSLYDEFRQEREDLNGQSMVQPTQAFVYIRTDRGDAFMPPPVDNQQIQLLETQPPPYAEVVGSDGVSRRK